MTSTRLALASKHENTCVITDSAFCRHLQPTTVIFQSSLPLQSKSSSSTSMARTRSKQSEVAKLAEAVSTDQEPSDTEAASKAASFKNKLSEFQYTGVPESPAKGTSSPAPMQRTAKRARPNESSTKPAPSPRVTKKKKRTASTKQRTPSTYADPSKYARLSPLVDILEPNLICVFVGTNPGVQTATAGHAYAHPSNHFWKLLHSSGLTDRRLKPEEDRSLPALYCMGNTNIVDRPSKNAAELSKEEMTAGTANLDAKFLKYKPEAVCIVGKGIWEAIWRYRYGRNMAKGEFKYGWQDEKDNMGRSRDGEDEVDGNGDVWKGTKVFVTTSTSGLAASLKPAEKEAIWKPFGDWVQKRRDDRGFVPRTMDTQEDRPDPSS
jgi:mismatch-specific thymine-DNA glycosylase